MDDLSPDTIFALATEFRSAIERSVPSTSSLATLRDFPRGACGDASLLLAKYLQVKGCGLPLFVVGNRDGHEHAWLRLQDYTIDITADQFQDQPAAVIVTAESSWHSSFNGNIYNVADFCLYDSHSTAKLTTAYHEITRCLKSSTTSAKTAEPLGTMFAVLGCQREKW